MLDVGGAGWRSSRDAGTQVDKGWWLCRAAEGWLVRDSAAGGRAWHEPHPTFQPQYHFQLFLSLSAGTAPAYFAEMGSNQIHF